MKRTLIYLLFLAWLVMTSVVMFVPAETVRETNRTIEATKTVKPHTKQAFYKVLHSSRTVHGFCFLGLAFLGSCLPLNAGFKTYVRVLLLLTAASLASELIQQYVVLGRGCEWRDIAMNELGIFVGATVALAIRKGKGLTADYAD